MEFGFPDCPSEALSTELTCHTNQVQSSVFIKGYSTLFVYLLHQLIKWSRPSRILMDAISTVNNINHMLHSYASVNLYWYGQLVGHQPLVVYLCVSVWVYIAILLGAWWMADYETLHVCQIPWCQQFVKFWWWPSDPLKFKKYFINLICHFVFQNMRSAGLISICGMEWYIINYTS